MNDLGLLISQVQHSDIATEEVRVKTERDKRKALRLQAGGGGMSINELVAKLSGSSEEKLDETTEVKTQEASHAARSGGFPPPPTSQSGSTGPQGAMR